MPEASTRASHSASERPVRAASDPVTALIMSSGVFATLEAYAPAAHATARDGSRWPRPAYLSELGALDRVPVRSLR